MTISLFLLITALTYGTSTSHILVAPYILGRNSRFWNLASLAELLAEQSHQVTILTNHRCLPRRQLQNVDVMVHPVPEDIPLPAEDNKLMLQVLKSSIFNSNLSNISTIFCQHFLSDSSLLPMLKSLNYDLLIVDYANICARILVDYLNIPTIVWSNFGFGIDQDLFYPIMPSFVPSPLGSYSHDMALWQRLKNFWEYHFYNNLLLNYYAFWSLDELKNNHGINVTLSIKDTYNRVKPLIICNADFVFDYPRPLMPHVIPISGLFFQDPEPLVGEINDFLGNSGPNGVILVSFGSLFKYLEEKHSKLLARVFARLPQLVIWRFEAPFHIERGNNTLLLPWVPQNDILAHNKTRLFITHCGISSAYEAIYHTVPILGMPLFADQSFNCRKLTERAKMGLQLDLAHIDDTLLESTIHQVISNKSFKENAQRMKEYLLDKPQEPRATFIYWVEHVIKHKGVEHLYSLPSVTLSWFQYFCIDVIALSLALVAITISGTLWLLIFILRFVTSLLSPAKKLKVN